MPRSRNPIPSVSSPDLPHSLARCPLYGISPLQLSSTFRVDGRWAERWKAQLRRNPRDAEAVARFVNADVGAFDDAWDGFIARDGLLWCPGGGVASPGEVRSIPFLKAQLDEYHRAQRWMLDGVRPGALSVSSVRGVVEHLRAALDALGEKA